MSTYQLEQTPKTMFLNVFRRLFTIPLLEKLLVLQTSGRSSGIIKKLVPPDYLYKKNSFRTVIRDGINYKLDLSNVVEHYVYYGNKDADYRNVLEVIKKSATILDIGANIGSISLYFASLNATAKIFSFEPHPDTFAKAVKNIALNKYKNIELINKGLGETKQTLKLYEVNKNNPGMNRIIAGEKNLPFKAIEIDSLDNIATEKNITQVDFIKLDVEGYEYSVLAGGASLLTTKPVLFIELDDNNLRENNKTAKELIGLILQYGYTKIYRADNLQTVSLDDDFANCHYDIIAK